MTKGLGKTNHVHLVGIGGAGMSAIAEVLLNQGFRVSGSDQAQSEVTERLTKLGATVFTGHNAANIERSIDVVVHSSAVDPERNLETSEARRKKIPVVKRDEMLGELMRRKSGICIAGTHGKTTTTTMTGIMLKECGENPTVLIGGISDYFKGSAVAGKGEYFVIESDEYDRTFLKLTPTIAVITTLEAEHLDIYADLADIKQAFVQFANKVPFYGAVIVCSDEINIQHILPEIHRKVITYGISSERASAAELQATDIRAEQSHSVFTVRFLGNELGKINLAVPGLHNVKNALAAVAVGLEIGLEFAAIKAGLEKFSAVRRRFQIKRGAEQGTMVVDDYAHHPTEVQATLEAAKSGWPERRIIAVFQPHLFSRTKDFAEAFGKAFTDADVLVVTDVYASRENAIDYEGVSGKLVADAAKKFGHKNVHYIAEKNRLPEFLRSLAVENDLVITLGAGDITKFGEAFINLLDQKS